MSDEKLGVGVQLTPKSREWINALVESQPGATVASIVGDVVRYGIARRLGVRGKPINSRTPEDALPSYRVRAIIELGALMCALDEAEYTGIVVEETINQLVLELEAREAFEAFRASMHQKHGLPGSNGHGKIARA